ncbi:MAG: hypothetical protein SGBAC_006622 [Bacillariaceae sp.]
MSNHHLSDAQQIKATESFFASEFRQLSVKDQTDAIDDLYCEGRELRENPAMVRQALQDFDSTLQTTRSSTYELAVSQNRSYVEDRSFRLSFLRANFFNSKKAIRQMLNFLRKKATYFGERTLARDISLEDLDEEEMKVILSGPYHVQEDRDRAGRVVIYFFNTMFDGYKAETLVRVTYYLWMNILLRMPEVQMKGVVGCYYDCTKPGEKVNVPDTNVLFALLEFGVTIPVRFSAMHYCIKTNPEGLALNNFFLEWSAKALPRYSRARARLHYGSHMELQYELRIHGLPASFPVDTAGNIRKEMLNVWFHVHLAKEQGKANPYLAQDSSEDEEMDDLLNEQDSTMPQDADCTNSKSLVVQPTNRDIMLGRGRHIQNHPGNIHFREMLEAYRDLYDQTPRNQRRSVSAEVARRLKGRGIRFLEQTKDNGGWMESSFEKCESTIRQLFRSRRKQRGG